MVEIRIANLPDVPAIERVAWASYGSLLRGDYSSEVLEASLPFMARVPRALIQTNSYFVAVLGRAIVGCGGWSGVDPKDGTYAQGRASIRKVAVHPDHLRKGIGRALMRHVHSTAKRDGFNSMHCLSSISAAPFYQACGYEGGERVDLPTGDPNLIFECVSMTRDI